MTTASPAPRFVVPETLDPDALRGFDPAAAVVDLDGETMGTRWRVRLALPGGHDAGPVGEAIQRRLDGLVAEMSHWDASSLLRRFNRARAGEWISLPPDFACVMACGLRVAEQSGGAFDPAMGRLTDIWGLGPNPVPEPPDEAARAEAMAHCGWRRLAFDAPAGRLRQPGGLWLDLSGIAKGHAADAVAGMLAERGLFHAMVEVGGECVGRGMRPDGDPWWVDVELPEGFVLPPLRVALHRLAVATSGDYLRGAHTLDPATGLPAIHQTTAVTVIHERCMEADAWATALSVLPTAQARDMARDRGLMARLLTRDGNEWFSPALLRLL
ncbi:MAG: FAD:protein FMN transferase [Novosphingobium sp.]|nr:FAD:protein FMN transferase [Novosphingobium sp.]